MKKTANYDLNQWEKSDRIMMEDFNADNAKLDAAFFNHPSAEFLLGGTVDTTVTQIDLDVSQVEWSKYLMVILEVESVFDTHIYLRGTKSQEACLYIYHAGPSTASCLMDGYDCHRFTAVMPVLYSGDRHPSVFGFGGGRLGTNSYRGFLSSGTATYTIREISTLQVYNASNFQPGDVVKLWGVK